jgi:AsmA protein
MKALKYALIGFGTVALIVGAVVAYLLVTFDPRDYEPRIGAMVKEQTGRTLHIAGEFSLSFWPDIGVRLGAVSLSERDSEERFADAENVRFTVKLAPLFSRTLIAEDLLVQGAHVRITRFTDGRLNIDDLFRSAGPTPTFDIARVKVQRSTLSYRNLLVEKRYEVTAVEVETGRLANVVVTPVKVSFAVRDDAKAFEMATALQGRLALDLGRRFYSIEQATVDMKGRVAEINGLSAQLKGNVAARAAAGELEATSVTLTSDGSLRGEQIQANMQAPKLRWSAGSLVLDSPTASLSSTGSAGNTRVAIASPSVAVRSESVVADTATVELDANRGDTAVNVSMQSAVEVQTDAVTLVLPKLESKVRVHGAGLPANGLSGTLAGHARFDLPHQAARASLAGVLGGSRVKADLAATGFAAPVYRFAVEVDQLDMDRFAQGRPSRAADSGGFDVSALSKLPATGTLHIGTLTSGGLKARNVKMSVKP